MKRALLVAAVVLSGCGSGSLEEDWAGPPRADAQGRVVVAGFNDYLDEYPDYAESLEGLAAEFLVLGEREASTITIVSQPSGRVVVTLLGLADDSVASERYVLEAEKQGDGWRLRSALRTQRCRAGRGHQGYSPALCV